MGYLNSDTVTVDAILTKHGRKLLANGQALSISQFALADDGVDYSLYNVDHPSGSTSYGDAITSLPMIEAVPDDSVIMRYKLNNLPRDTEYLPYLTGLRDVVLEEFNSEDTITPGSGNWSALTESSYQFLVTDISNIDISGQGVTDTSYTNYQGTAGSGIPYSTLYHGSHLVFRPKNVVSADVTIHVTVYGVDSGATSQFSVTIKKND
jgi:hypothetical protein